MNDPMTILKADHRQVEKMLTTLAESEEGPERQALTDELTAALSLHMEIEENLVYPQVADKVGAQDEEEAEIEHGLAREGLAKVVGMVEQPGFGAAVEMLKGGISHHVHEEESELLPELKDAISREEWLKMGDAIAQAKADAGMPAAPPATKRSTKRKPASSAAKK